MESEAHRQIAFERHSRYSTLETASNKHWSDPRNLTAIKNIASDEPNVLESLAPAFQRYNEEQFTTVKLPGGSQSVWKTDAKQ